MRTHFWPFTEVVRKIGREVTRKSDGPTVAIGLRQRMRDSKRSGGLVCVALQTIPLPKCRMIRGNRIAEGAQSCRALQGGAVLMSCLDATFTLTPRSPGIQTRLTILLIFTVTAPIFWAAPGWISHRSTRPTASSSIPVTLPTRASITRNGLT